MIMLALTTYVTGILVGYWGGSQSRKEHDMRQFLSEWNKLSTQDRIKLMRVVDRMSE